MERNLHDAMGVARNVMLDPRLVPGGGACEMAVSRGLADRADAVIGPEQARCTVHRQSCGLLHEELELQGMPIGCCRCLASSLVHLCGRVCGGKWPSRAASAPALTPSLAQSRRMYSDLEPHHMLRTLLITC